MVPFDEARTFVLDRCSVLPASRQRADRSVGLILAERVMAAEQIPPFDNTAVDGFAVVAADTASAPVELQVVGTLATGAPPNLRVAPGQTVRIMTGAPMPPGADAVVMVERTELSSDGSTVRIDEGVTAGDAVRRAGDDLRIGQVVFEPGEVITPGHVGVLASLGIYEVLVHPRPRVGVISTGDELVDGPGELGPGQIRDSNRYTLLALVEQVGAVGVDLGLIADDEQAIEEALLGAAASCDAIVSSGGVSMGAFDFVKVVLDRVADMRWMQVAIKPAKPLAFGTISAARRGESAVVPVFGLPGNPVSSMVSFELFCRPGLRKLMGHETPIEPPLAGVAAESLRRRPDGKTHFVRVMAETGANGRVHVRSAGGQGSHQLWAMANAQGLAVLPDGPGVEVGEDVGVLLFDR